MLRPISVLELTFGLGLVLSAWSCTQQSEDASIPANTQSAEVCAFDNGQGQEKGRGAEECDKLRLKYGQPILHMPTIPSDSNQSRSQVRTVTNPGVSDTAFACDVNGQKASTPEECEKLKQAAMNPPSAQTPPPVQTPPVTAPAPQNRTAPRASAATSCSVVIEGKTEKAEGTEACQQLQKKALAAFRLPPLNL